MILSYHIWTPAAVSFSSCFVFYGQQGLLSAYMLASSPVASRRAVALNIVQEHVQCWTTTAFGVALCFRLSSRARVNSFRTFLLDGVCIVVRDPEAHTRKLIMFIVMSYPLLSFSKTGSSSHSLPPSAWRKSLLQQRGKKD
jgi:hypothetical protein